MSEKDDFPVRQSGQSAPAEQEEKFNSEDLDNEFRRMAMELPPPPRRAEGQRRDDAILPAAKDWAIQAHLAGLNISQIAVALQRGRNTIYSWMKDDKEFGARWNEAHQVFKDLLQGEAFRRGVKGWSPKEGITSYSDPLMKMMLQAEIPEKYAPKEGGALIQVNIGDVQELRKGKDKEQDVIDGTDLVRELEE